jgi:hypothetical protein
MRDYIEDTTFAAADIAKLPIIVRDLTLTEYAGPDGQPLVVNVYEGPQFWIQFSRKHGFYRCAQKKGGEVTAYWKEWREAQ